MKLSLYMFDGCPYCARVMREIASEGRTDIEVHDIHKSDEDYEYLRKNSGQTQVPCLFIDGKPMLESLDIIAFLKENPQ